MANLVEHARRELELVGEEPATIQGYLKVVEAFSEMGHSGGSASVAIPTLNRLLQFKNLTPITNDPDEWVHHGSDVWPSPDGQGIWQNSRDSEAFSSDGGKTYSLLSDGEVATVRPVHISVIRRSNEI